MSFRCDDHGAGRRRYPGDIGDEAARSLLIAADLQRLNVVRRAVAGSVGHRQGLMEGEGKNLQDQGSQQQTADKCNCP